MTEEIQKRIIELFMKNVYGKKSDTSKSNPKHAGKEGHWLEKQMGVKPNNKSKADLMGYECKNETTSKTTWGDWGPDYKIWERDEYGIDREKFMRIFGHNPKGYRYSWSGKPVPKIGHRLKKKNEFGTRTHIDTEGNVTFYYSYDEDMRNDKRTIVPDNLRENDLILQRWSAKKLRVHVDEKFNRLGWFKCSKGHNGYYDKIIFGNPTPFEDWISWVRNGDVYFDGGMYEGNNRPYNQWRSPNKFWNSLAVQTYPD